MCNLTKDTIAFVLILLVALLVIPKIIPTISNIGSFGISTIYSMFYWVYPPPKCEDEEGCQFIVKSAVYGEKNVSGTFVDLALPFYKTPLDLESYRQGLTWRYYKTSSIGEDAGNVELHKEKRELRYGNASVFLEEAIKGDEKKTQKQRVNGLEMDELKRESRASRERIGTKTVALGSEDEIYYTGNMGLFAAVLEAYNHHWNLRISPDDFWLPITRRIASLIDDNSGKETVRKFFVDHIGKEKIIVETGADSIYDVPYQHIFKQFSKQIGKRIKVPDYAENMRANFTTSTPELQIVSSITLMSSLQEYFEYELHFICGIKAVEMLGTFKDWEQLQQKFDRLIEILEPIKQDLASTDGFNMTYWISSVKKTLGNLVSTYRGRPDTVWWSKIMDHEVKYGSGRSHVYSGWIVEFLQGKINVDGLSEFSTGLSVVPMLLVNGGFESMSHLVGGMLGYTVHGGNETLNGVPSIRPFQGWAMLLNEDCPFRKDRKTK
ncbi:uncharacterized protein [Clytia hemisphaerica]|uniref:uncharacterized protein n=1 Tax=Clytia hemisphaerica TaxID=252671 RepID=UPI0034D3C03C